MILAARDVERGSAAAGKLQDIGLSDVVFHQLDLTDKASIESLEEFIRTRFGKLNILVPEDRVKDLLQPCMQKKKKNDI